MFHLYSKKEIASVLVKHSLSISSQSYMLLVNALEKASVFRNKHDIKILPPSVHSYHESIQCCLSDSLPAHFFMCGLWFKPLSLLSFTKKLDMTNID